MLLSIDDPVVKLTVLPGAAFLSLNSRAGVRLTVSPGRIPVRIRLLLLIVAVRPPSYVLS